MQPVLSAQQMREIDRLTVEKHHVTSFELMESAAAACLNSLTAHFGNLAGKKLQIVCGPGNNGGDGAALARQLLSQQVQTDVILIGNFNDTRGDARTNFEQLSSLAANQLTFTQCGDSEAWEQVATTSNNYDVIVDALFGTGLTRPLSGVFAKVVERILDARNIRRTSNPLIFSVDIPSGLDADKAESIGPAVNADLTVTFTAPKPANVLAPAAHFNGKLVVADIGSPRSLIDAQNSSDFLIESSDAREWLIRTRYAPESYKKTHGEVLVVAGSNGYAGAAVLCANAAMRAGTGLVTMATPVSLQNAVASSVVPEVMTQPLAETDRGAISDEAIAHLKVLSRKATVLAIGPGLSASDERTRRFTYAAVAERTRATVVDADGLNCLAPWPAELRGSHDLPIILTPHIGEMRRLLGVPGDTTLDHVSTARSFATQHNLILVLKGSRTVVAAPDGRIFINPTGNAGMGTAGMGDTVTGIIAAFLAEDAATLQNEADALKATIAALYVVGLAADIAARNLGMRTMMASDVRDYLSVAIQWLDPLGEQPRLIQ
ncbi:MAG TPA: NAD(P)H-hydrate dehydratase [Pyrinomonadaceae bacterium]|nr:NAD(P)H-hydrate dehydratase [Pyrinomonadaceae bacterium]